MIGCARNKVRARLRTRRAREAAAAVLAAYATAPAPPLAAALLAQLRADAAQLGDAHALRATATRRVQGARSRVRTATAALFASCSEIRRLVREHFRGRRQAALRRAFGEGACPSGQKTAEVQRLAAQIVAAAPQHEAELRAARVLPRHLARLLRCREVLAAAIADRRRLRKEREDIAARLAIVADRALLACTALGPQPEAPRPAQAEGDAA